MKPIFITGIGTGVGKTIVSAMVTEALQADYWKPVQAGIEDGTDALQVQHLISNTTSVIHPEAFKLSMPASPHIAARNEAVSITVDALIEAYENLPRNNPYLVIEGAGGLLVPLNEHEFLIDLITRLQADVILVSRNYLGSINHSLLSAAMCRQQNIPVLGWMFNDQYLDYEKEIAGWSGYPVIGSIPFLEKTDQEEILKHARRLRDNIMACLT